MNPIEIVPGATLVAFFTVMIGIVLSSFVVGTLGVLMFIIIFYYTRGPTVAISKLVVSDHLVCPCDGVVTNMFCDIQRNTHVTIHSDMLNDRRGFYSVLSGTVKLIEKEQESLKIYVETPVGHVVNAIKMEGLADYVLFVATGSQIQKGEILCFIPLSANIELTLPVYQSSFVVNRGTQIHAGDLLADANQVWSL